MCHHYLSPSISFKSVRKILLSRDKSKFNNAVEPIWTSLWAAGDHPCNCCRLTGIEVLWKIFLLRSSLNWNKKHEYK